ncbi:MAG: DUF4259 domain-containing protein [Crocinitomicaceae bacterium]|nr:DUF4259 domain-containing protein [Crocinitomicaceae bacterium]
MWGSKPWDNDKAADWFSKLMETTDLPAEVRSVLKSRNEEKSEVLRAAVFCVLQFGRVYVWPINDLNKDLQHAIAALEKILEDEDYCYSQKVISEINEELSELKRRISPLQ